MAACRGRLYEERGVVDQMPKLLIAQSVLKLVEERGKTRLEVFAITDFRVDS